MFSSMKQDLQRELQSLSAQGLYKGERVIESPQSASITVGGGNVAVNFCANNYLGLADDPEIIEAAATAMRRWGYGLASVRFICGTQAIHRQLEQRLSRFLGTEDTILYAACFDANGGVFEPLLGQEDAIISDELNHASIIDGVRLCKATRARYNHSDMADLERCLKEHTAARYRIICTDGVFSMDGDIARLPEICDLAEQYDALVMVDDCHATGYIGQTGRGTAEQCGVQGRIDIVTTTFGKALGGASGGCTSGRREIIEMLRQRSRPYLFSNTLAPSVVGGTLKALDIVESSHDRIATVKRNTQRFKSAMVDAGFDIGPTETAIVPVMLYQEPLALKMADQLLHKGVYVIGFAYPVVPRGRARIRVQLSAAHSEQHLDRAITAFVEVGRELGVI
ncbi:MAG: glycine C-acetyltransferase [Spirochaetaceae bacterium]|nr:MAG: glycine C-acetyltransferase [Spirochaetaceae bacterium]